MKKNYLLTLVILLFVLFQAAIAILSLNENKKEQETIKQEINLVQESLQQIKQPTTAGPEENYNSDFVDIKSSISSLNESIYELKGKSFAPKAAPKEDFTRYRKLALFRPEPSKIDSLYACVTELNYLIKASLNRPQVLAEKGESIKAVAPYYRDISIVFKTRKSSIFAKVQQQYWTNLRYGQVFYFEKTVPSYLYNFTNSAGTAMTLEQVKEFLIQKEFWLNSIELRENQALINCSNGK